MIHHDKHQYYFEKYLRNEMSYHERMSFDEKLGEDAALKQAFMYYRANRDSMLKELIEEHRLARRDNRLNKIIFLLISLTGIALTFNYYLYKGSPSQTEANGELKQRKPLYTYIPFVNWEKRSERNIPKKEIPRPDSLPVEDKNEEVAEESIEVLEPSARDEERTMNDVFLTDSFITVYDRIYVQSLIAAKKIATPPDTDSVITPPKPKSGDKNSQLFVEFWQSPVKYRGYLFNGKKLIIYGINAPYEVYIYKEEDVLQMIHPFGETPLAPQSNFIAF